ncbi:transporter substrate-binding domain-containing protein [Legionella shakespearei]|uniref:Glutamine ABC transporter n=1 Tax=Legionella shakespearei DSM 23087 TaxID=1122169 RepID=A0A0W0YLY0_9GAMM|nr:transporter substrate-binding domain-containing protein [Legionella shakespearei]KTD57598.1 glutamine ABC transporter [Legionella shakespearei DSM 23087]
MKLTQISAIRLLIVIFMIGLVTVSFGATLKVGVGVSGAPIVEKVASEHGPYYFGFCIDLMDNICARIDQQCVYKQITLNDQFESLNNGDIDLLVLVSPYSPEDLKQYAMSIPYAVSKIQFVALQNSPIDDLADIKNKKIGVVKTTFYNLLLRSPFHNQNQIIAYKSDSELLTDLAQKKIDVIVLNNVVAYRLKTNDLYNIKFVGKDMPLGEGYGIIALPDKTSLINEISKAILSLQKDGTYVSIYQKYYKPE